MNVYTVTDNWIYLLADSLPWFAGGVILGAALQAFLPTTCGLGWFRSPRASVFTATIAGAILPGCSMVTVPLAAAVTHRSTRLGTLAAFIMISPILSPETIILTAAMLGTKFTVARIVLPLIATLLMGTALNALQDLGIKQFQVPPNEAGASHLESNCCGENELSNRRFWRSLGGVLHPLWIYFLAGLLAVAILQAIVPPSSIAAYLHGGSLAYLLAAVVGIPMYACEGAEVPLTYGLIQAGVGIGPAFTFMLGAAGTCLPAIAMAPRVIGRTATYIYLAVWLVLAIGGGWIITLI